MDVRDAGRVRLRRATRALLSEFDEIVEGTIDAANNANESLPELTDEWVKRALQEATQTVFDTPVQQKELGRSDVQA